MPPDNEDCMIIPVQNEHEAEWNDLCIALWPQYNIDDILRLKQDGWFRNEFLYFFDKKAVAFISLSLRQDYVEGTRTSPVAYIEGLYVNPDYRNRGIARKLVSYAKKWAYEKNCQELASDTELVNQSSQKFHEMVGFTKANTIVCYTMKISKSYPD